MTEIENVDSVWISSEDGSYQFESDADEAGEEIEAFRLHWSAQGLITFELDADAP